MCRPANSSHAHRADRAGRGSRRGPPTGRAAARLPRRSNTSMPQSRSTSRALPQRAAPRLVPALRPAGVAAAVGHPPLHAVGARPGAGAHPHLGRRGATRRGGRPAAARARRRPARRRPAPAPPPRRRRRGGGRRSRRRWRRPPARRSRGRRRGCWRLDGASKARAWARRAVVDDEVDGAVGVVGVAPAVEAAARRLVGVDLAGGEDREADALLGEHAQHEVVHRRLRQPHALGAPAEAVGEVEDPPAHVGADVALVAEREDGVAVGLGDGAAGRAVGVDDALVHVGVVGLEPRQQRGPDVERQLLEGAELGVGSVALRGDALVPVVERRRARLLGHDPRPGVLAGRLVEVPVEHRAAVPVTIVDRLMCRG